MSGNPPTAVADFFAAFETASHLMECPAAPARAVPEAAAMKVEASVTTEPAIKAEEPVETKRASAPRSKRRHGLGGAGVDLGDVMAGWPPLRTGNAR